MVRAQGVREGWWSGENHGLRSKTIQGPGAVVRTWGFTVSKVRRH